MSRFRRVVHGVASGYGVLVTTAIYGLASVPVALHYLSPERFGLWALMSSIGAYLSLIDLGMSSSVARLLVDHKDDRASGNYGRLIKTGWLVLLAQAMLLLVVGFVLAPVLWTFLKGIPPKGIPIHLEGDFIALMRWQSVVLALGFATRIFSHLLNAHQRVDLFNLSQMANLLLQFVFLWWFFYLGQGVFSLVWASLVGSVSGAGICLAACWKLRLFPPSGAWGRASWACFKDVFDYGKDVFLVAVGTQLILFSQSMIITRCVGINAAAAWVVGTRVYNLVSQALWRVFDFSGPALSEMIVRGERALLRERFKGLVILSAALSGVSAVVFALCNTTFVSIYAHGKVYWSPLNDVLLGLWMIVMTILHCHNSFVLLTKKVQFMRYVYFVEGLVFVAASLLLAGWGGLPAMILCSVAASTCFSGAYGVWRMSRYFGFSVREIGLAWQAPMIRVLAWFAPAALLWWWGSERMMPALADLFSGLAISDDKRLLLALGLRLAGGVLFGGVLGSYLFLRLGLPPAIQRELLQRVPRRVNPILQRVFALEPL